MSSVVTVVRAVPEVRPLVSWSARFAQAIGADDLVLVMPSGSEVRDIDLDDEGAEKDPLFAAVRDARRAIQARATPLPAEGWHEGLPVPDLRLRLIGSENPLDRVLLELDEQSAQMVVFGDGEGSKGDRLLSRELLRRAPCEALWWRNGERDAPTTGRLLVPVAGGPNAEKLLERAAGICEAMDGEVHALMVEPRIGRDAEAVGRQIAEKTVRRTVQRYRERISVRVSVSDDAVQSITAACEEGDYEALLVGASPFSALRRFFAGNVAERLRDSASCSTSVGVYRKAMPLSSRMGSRLDSFFREHVPQLDRAGRLELAEKIQSASSWNFDFVALTCLSTCIAALGLIRDSTAVVIGAMLVAPLMTPLVGCGLAIVQGNARLIRGAARAVSLGFLLALAIGLILGWIVPDVVLTDQMVARGGPNGIDLAIAVASGLAAAYATARPGLSGAIPGVAIAAALVPPIATSGLAASLGDWTLCLGSFLLFLTNIVAIVVSSAISLYAVGLRIDRDRKRNWRLRLWIGLLVLTALLLSILGVNS